MAAMQAVVQAHTPHDLVAPADVWSRQVGQWHLLRSPLRPSDADVALYQQEVDELAVAGLPLKALLLGVTPELLGLRWPVESSLLAVDRCSAMLRDGWHPPQSVSALPVQAEWGRLPAIAGAFNLVMADGSLNALPDPASVRQVLEQIARVLAPGGKVVIRCFVRPEAGETPAEVMQEFRSSGIGSIHVAKFRLAMALQALQPAQGVVLDEIWQAFRAAEPDSRALALRTGWPLAQVDTVDAYRGIQARFLFPTLAELRQLARPWFRESACHSSAYEMGERCPMLVLARST